MNQPTALTPEVTPALPGTQMHSASGGSGSGQTPRNAAQERLLRFGGIAASVLVALAVIVYVISSTRFDSYFTTQTLVVTVVDDAGGALPGAAVELNEKVTATGADGSATFGDLEIGTYQLKVAAEGFVPNLQELYLAASFPDYTQRLTITLQPSNAMRVSGKLIAPQTGYQFIDDRILVGSEEYKVNLDGTFNLDLTTATNEFVFKSVNFVDVKRKIAIDGNATTQQLEPIELVPAGDIVGSIESYITQTPIADLKISAEGVSQDQISIDTKINQFRIQDLEVGKQYQIRLSHPSYLERDYTQTAAQGESALFGARIVEKGKMVFLAKPEGSNNIQIFSSNWDGGERTQLTSDRVEPYGEYVDAEGVVYFMSTRDNQQSKLGGRALLAYAVPATGQGNIQRITTNVENLGFVTPNFQAKILINITTTDRTRENRIVELIDLTGNNRSEIFTLDKGQIYDLQISNGGTAIAFGVKSAAEGKNGLYWIDLLTKEVKQISQTSPVQIFDLSDSGKLILYTKLKEDNATRELYLFNVATNSDRRIRSTFTGSQYQFVAGSEKDLVFYDQRNGDNNVYTLNLDNTSDERLTNFRNLEGVEAVYQQNGYVIYQTNKGMYALDFAKPVAGKLVTANFTRYTGYDF